MTKRDPTTRYSLFVLVPLLSTLFCLAAVEIFIRAALFSSMIGENRIRQPRHFGDPWLDDDCWKLDFLFDQMRPKQPDRPLGQIEFVRHEMLGWAPEVTEANPLGIVSDRPYMADGLQRPILFFGDSYVDGPELFPNKIPQILDSLVEERAVLNYGVSGYGLGQIYLRYLTAVQEHDDPVAIVGIMVRDLDRTIMTVRNAQKPLVTLDGRKIVVRNVPVGDTYEFLERNPIEIQSYLVRAVLIRLRGTVFKPLIDRMLGYDERHSLKLEVNRRILQELRRDAAARKVPLFVVLFYTLRDMQSETWRGPFLKGTLEDLGLPYFDTKTFLLEKARAEGINIDQYWSPSHGHHNRAANAVLAAGIAGWLDQTAPHGI